jgi:hypothetical protein
MKFLAGSLLLLFFACVLWGIQYSNMRERLAQNAAPPQSVHTKGNRPYHQPDELPKWGRKKWDI